MASVTFKNKYHSIYLLVGTVLDWAQVLTHEKRICPTLTAWIWSLHVGHNQFLVHGVCFFSIVQNWPNHRTVCALLCMIFILMCLHFISGTRGWWWCCETVKQDVIRSDWRDHMFEKENKIMQRWTSSWLLLNTLFSAVGVGAQRSCTAEKKTHTKQN